MITQETRYNEIIENIPGRLHDTDILLYMQSKEVNWEYVQALKKITNLNDEVLSGWLNVSVKTFRAYKKPEQEISIGIKEHVLLLLSLIHHGKKVFRSTEKFEEWLKKENFFFDQKAPIDLLKTITGIRFTDDRLTALEYGDNL